MKVTLRKKTISDGRESLYLDFYPPIPNPETGKPTRREFLQLFLISDVETEQQHYTGETGKPAIRFVPVLDKNAIPKRKKLSPIDKLHNKETLALAENIRAKRQIEIQNGQYGFLSGNKGNTDFIQYFRELANKRTGSNNDNWLSSLRYLEDYTNGNIRFADLNESFCNDFRQHLLTTHTQRSATATLTQNTAGSYFVKFKTALKQAYSDGYLQTDLNTKIERIRETETNRQFLTIDELQALVKTDCEFPVLKSAALFSILTGLRVSDIEKLIWDEVRTDKDEKGKEIYYLQFIQQKTKGAEVLPIPEQAYRLLGERSSPTDKVFQGFNYSSPVRIHLKYWLQKAGITKHITFHCFRHTYAMLQLSAGTDIYTLSKMLGHRDLKTTEIYAKVMNKAKRETTDKIKLEF